MPNTSANETTTIEKLIARLKKQLTSVDKEIQEETNKLVDILAANEKLTNEYKLAQSTNATQQENTKIIEEVEKTKKNNDKLQEKITFLSNYNKTIENQRESGRKNVDENFLPKLDFSLHEGLLNVDASEMGNNVTRCFLEKNGSMLLDLNLNANQWKVVENIMPGDNTLLEAFKNAVINHKNELNTIFEDITGLSTEQQNMIKKYLYIKNIENNKSDTPRDDLIADALKSNSIECNQYYKAVLRLTKETSTPEESELEITIPEDLSPKYKELIGKIQELENYTKKGKTCDPEVSAMANDLIKKVITFNKIKTPDDRQKASFSNSFKLQLHSLDAHVGTHRNKNAFYTAIRAIGVAIESAIKSIGLIEKSSSFFATTRHKKVDAIEKEIHKIDLKNKG